MVKTSRQFKRDKWGISATLLYTYGDVVVHDAAMGFAVIGNLNWIGNTPKNLKAWKLREDRNWEKYMKSRGESEKRVTVFETRKNLECWRTETSTYERDDQSSLSISYDCWQPGKTNYPPLTIGGWIGYRDGKPIYDLDIDKDLIDPVFATLEVKDIKPEVYAERMAIHEKKMVEDCKWRKKDLRKHPSRAWNAYELKRLEACGFNTSKLKRKEE